MAVVEEWGLSRTGVSLSRCQKPPRAGLVGAAPWGSSSHVDHKDEGRVKKVVQEARSSRPLLAGRAQEARTGEVAGPDELAGRVLTRLAAMPQPSPHFSPAGRKPPQAHMPLVHQRPAGGTLKVTQGQPEGLPACWDTVGEHVLPATSTFFPARSACRHLAFLVSFCDRSAWGERRTG